MRRLAMAALLALVLCGPAGASGTIMGTPGGFLVPTTEVTTRGRFTLEGVSFGMAPFAGVSFSTAAPGQDAKYDAYLQSVGSGGSLNYSPFKGVDVGASFFQFRVVSQGDAGTAGRYSKTSAGRIYSAKYAMGKPVGRGGRFPAVAVGVVYMVPDGDARAFGRIYAVADANIGKMRKRGARFQRYTHVVAGADIYTGEQDRADPRAPSKSDAGVMLAFYEEWVDNDNPTRNRRGFFAEYSSTDFLGRTQEAVAGNARAWTDAVSASGGTVAFKSGKNNAVFGAFRIKNGTSIKGGILLSNRGIDARMGHRGTGSADGKRPLPFTWFLSGGIGL